MDIDYDETLSKTIDEEEINYGIIYGNLEVKVIHGADHEFRGMLEEHISLIDLL